jgi:hypothetical protein
LPASTSLRRRRAPELAGLALAALGSLLLAQRFPGELSVQSWRNLRFAQRGSLERSLERYGMLRPPLYPSVLWLAARARIHPFAVTALLQAAALAGIAALTRRSAPGIPPLLPVGAYAVAHFTAVNLRQFTAEAVVAAALPPLALLLARHRATGATLPLLGAALLSAGLCLTRLFAASVALPSLALAALWPGHGTARRRVALAGAALVLATAPLTLWAYMARQETGYLTGDDRRAERVLPESIAHWRELRDLDDQLRLTGRTLLVDFFSPDRYAALAVVTRPIGPSPLEWAAVVLAACALIVGLHAVWRSSAPRGPGGLPPALLASPALVAAGLVALHLAATVAVWAFANNDPIHTRFLFPAYPLVVATSFAAYAWLRRRGASSWALRSLEALFVLFLVAQLARHVLSPVFPARYE